MSEFLRFSKKAVAKILFHSFLQGTVFVSFSVYWLSCHSSGPVWVHFRVMSELFFLAVTSLVGFCSLFYLIKNLKHYTRAAVVFAVIAAVFYNFISNIYNYFFYFEKLTTTDLNHLYLCFAVGSAIMLESARAERERVILTKALPKEHQQRFIKRVGDFRERHEGIVVLVDMVDFTRVQAKLLPQDQRKFIEGLLGYLMGVFNDASKLDSTGDGFYFAWEEEFTSENFEKRKRQIQELLETELKLGLFGVREDINRLIQFRCAMGFGEYMVGMVTKNEMTTHYSFGAILSQLSRILGSAGGETPELRVLITNKTRWISQYTKNPPFRVTGKRDEFFECVSYFKEPTSVSA